MTLILYVLHIKNTYNSAEIPAQLREITDRLTEQAGRRRNATGLYLRYFRIESRPGLRRS
jgi:hypothetical protein